ncbi:hypothetical protein H6G74_15510 [Nostoc spongiaeforme FACHB-130]|uniref:Uncharacterized protein n=1 Tax=Nostoc spongiaeforme FACHB-130 TaxID=1357510 RepID=A0ABR8FZC7_9NOSO|nr:hypothetical protein [Nostoc spongiaeforme]MBD2595724.1 hypothetical protein [Nostoc spongiaeforme FACHB-130]
MNLEQRIKEQAAQLAALKAEKDKQEAEKAKAKAFEWNSKFKLVKFLEQYLDSHIRLGKLNPDIFFDVYRKYKEVYQDQDDQLSFFVATVIKLISHPWYGVECSTAFIGNGGLLYKGKQYQDPQKLYLEIVFNTILGELANDPFGTDVWFYELLSLHFEDPTAFPAYAQIGEVKTRVLPLLKRIIETEQATQELPELSELTTDDALYIQSLFS